jgi:peptidyl-prolyl cis-trans isomerase C
MSIRPLIFSVLLFLYAAPTLLFAQTIAKSKQAEITAKDLDAELLKVNPDQRSTARNDARSISQLMETLHTYFAIAKNAKDEQFDADPLVRRSMEIASLKQLVTIYLNAKSYEQIIEAGDLTAAAQEIYALRKAQYVQPESIETSHILISTEGRSSDEAMRLATEIRSKLTAGTDFGEVASKFSEDTASKANGGKLSKRANKTDLVEPYWNAARALRRPGELSAPIRTEFGFHIIRLDAFNPETVTPFGFVRDQIIDELKAKRAEKYRTDLISKIVADPSIKIDDDAFEKYTGATRITPKK